MTDLAATITIPAPPHVVPFAFNGSSTSVSGSVPGLFPVAIAGHPYLVDTNPEIYLLRWRHESLPILRPQADQSSSPSESSLNPDALWRRGADSWHGGAGQVYRDRPGLGDQTRFRSSKGLNPWTPGQLSMLNGTDQKKVSSNTNLKLVVAGARLYCVDGSTLTYTADVTTDSPTWNTVTYAGGSILSICSDGFTVYLTDGSNIYTTNTGSSTASSVNTLDASVVAYVKGRLMAAGTGATSSFIYNITTIGTPPSAFNSPLDANFAWVGFAGGKSHIYAAGYSGDKSLIYKTAVTGEFTSLDAPSVAGELPDGEIIRSIDSYLGFIFLGTSSGVRFCETDASGNLVIGPILSDSPCYAFEGQEKFVWFGWDSYDSVSTGLGRMSLETFTINTLTDARAPAYASDLMVTNSGSVTSIVTFQGIRVFAISASGIWADAQTILTSATMLTGLISFGIPDAKIALSVNARTIPLPTSASYSAAISIDEATTFTPIDTESLSSSVTHDFPITSGTGRHFEMQFTFTAGSTSGPTLQRWTMKATTGSTDTPAEIISVPLVLTRETVLSNGMIVYMNVTEEREFLKDLRRTRTIFSYQEATTAYAVQMENYEWHPQGFSDEPSGGGYDDPNGVFFAQMKRLN